MPSPTEVAVAGRVAAFRAGIRREMDNEALVDEFVLHGSCYAVGDGVYYEIKRRIADEFRVDLHTEVFVVGSGKLGFSIAPHKRWRPCTPGSDIDVAIVSHGLYQRVWHELHAYDESGADWPKRAEFFGYHSRGWLRPDLAPASPILVMGELWWEFFRGLKSLRLAGARKINAAVYHDMHFLRRYQANAVAACREELENAN